MVKIRKKIYLDYAATTPVDKEVLKAMMPYFSLKFGNPSSNHSFGQEAIAAIDKAREKISRILNCQFDEIIFTGSATEANNLAIKGLVQNYNYTTFKRSSVSGRNKFHIISTNIEHESVQESLRELEKLGHKITHLKVNKDGFISVSDLENNIKNNTLFISVIYANNEIGTIQPVKEIGRLIEKINVKRKEQGLNRIYFHTDAVQALQFLECRPNWLKADLMTFSGHKIYGPKGIGALYVRRGTPLIPIITGGGQEFGLRSGTENIASIAGFAKAVELALKNREKRFKKILDLRNKLLNSIIKYNKDAKTNGSLLNRLPNNLNIRFPGVSNETLIIALDQAGAAVSVGSACSSGATTPSHVLTAIGLTEKQAKESVRITLGKDTTEKEIRKTAILINQKLKKLS
ncbi:hypothetical protein A2567_01710 [Candidatus Azambacteria bacterium RIFOXYD1_FULL_42_11]|uniref:Cysteine desulfurase n=3 Tax=Candidatus Azamiibacteriota TaxID=1752741 RepID=A0A0G0ZCY7_9BACT|nr:MAG: Cysteine desulfurase [Candidatus Azambacteria bacterium GW2011_GWB1_42_17]KKS46562.1 MAG: Cysteine desulfurase [Candidatus Azambacteria bacterium GW2011_GWA1_42_19]KKS88868.1 MAG: Cysteine desulfurase [Parcubacteria group bacterium GW2011_GWC1_43_11]OGD43155.1 MAG: hypothetical protein A2567_01710 [Candidatus Azambacteria bacterium RIFOXYD1_FULL_42_11]